MHWFQTASSADTHPILSFSETLLSLLGNSSLLRIINTPVSPLCSKAAKAAKPEAKNL
jgi:hypothetical protein